MSKIEVNQISSQCGSTLTIGQSGDTVTLACGATQSGFGRTGTVDWDTTAKTAGFTAVSGNGYFVNTTSGAITVTLPAGSAGAIVSLADYTNTWQTNSVTVTPNGSEKINGGIGSIVLNTEGQSLTLVYVDATEGWKSVQDSTTSPVGSNFIAATGGTVTCCGNYKIHTFTSPGTFTVTYAGTPAGSNTVDYLVVAGGGGGGSNQIGNGGGAGGGAGGYRESSGAASGCYSRSPLGACVAALPVTATSYPIVVGGGGSGGTAPNRGSSGSNSSFSTITSTGGGGGGTGAPLVPQKNGDPGGSGGGAGSDCAPNVGGSGNTPPVSPPQGNDGGNNCTGAKGAGGGGAISAGGDMTAPVQLCGPSGAGGAGATTSISASPTSYAGGGGAGAYANNSGGGGPGGLGGGGNGADFGNSGTVNGDNGTANTGGGAGGAGMTPCSPGDGGNGGSGIVIIRYKYQ